MPRDQLSSVYYDNQAVQRVTWLALQGWSARPDSLRLNGIRAFRRSAVVDWSH